MVMHARKQPRLDDGYKDKRSPHLYQSKQYPSKSHDESYRKREGSRGCRDAASPSRDSPRYHNKKSYIERDKNRMDRGSYSSLDKKYSHASSSTSASNYDRKNSQNGGNDKTGGYDKGGAKVRDSREQSRDSRESKDSKDHKPEVQKSAIRTCGDWSEYFSSIGKPYYYNHKSEVSQWEKPKDWNDRHAVRHDHKAKDGRGTDKDSSRNKHSISNEKLRGDRNCTDNKRNAGLEFNPSIHNEKPDKVFLIKKFQDSQRQVEMERPNMESDRRTSSSHTFSQSSSKRAVQEHSKTNSHLYSKETGTFIDHSHSANSGHQRSRSRRDSEGTRSHHGHLTPRKHDDMDISPGSTPTSSRPSSCVGTPQIAASTPASLPNPSISMNNSIGANNSSSSSLMSTLPLLINQLGGAQNNQRLTQKGIHGALETLQKLQEAITRQIAQQTSSSSSTQSQNSGPLYNSSQTMNQQSITSRLSAGNLGNVAGGQTQQYSHHTNSHPGHNSHPQHHHQQQQGPVLNTFSSPTSVSNHVTSLHRQEANNLHPHVNNSVVHGNTSSVQPVPSGSVYGRLANTQNQSVYTPLHVDTSNSVAVADRGGVGGDRSPVHGTSPKSSCGSPSSTTSSQEHHPATDPGLSVATTGLNKTESPNIGPSYTNYYNDKLIGHVTGWQGDHSERQALRYWEEGINVGSFHCGQVSVELKRARSLVRLAEIQSTLHEQRCMFLSQQIHELEGLKAPSFSSSHSFNTSS